MAFLGDSLAYGEEFSRIKTGESRLSLPWLSSAGQHFWEYYLGNCSLDCVDSEKAWKCVLPFKAPSPCKVASSPPVRSMNMECYHYPHSIGVVVNIVLQQDGTLNETVEAAFNARDVWTYEGRWSDETVAKCSINAIARRGLDELRAAALGEGVRSEAPLQPPFSVATAVEGDVNDPTVENPANGDVHRALEALSGWHPLWKINPLHPLDASTSYPFKNKKYMPAGHLLYGLESGRAVWFPGYFPKTLGKKVRTLGCYHRNLVLVTLQTAGLLACVQLGATHMKSGKAMPAALEGLVRKATAHLTSLYCAKKGETYRSWSPYRQVKDGGVVEMINYVRDRFGWAKLDP
jgi:hypothetical protein